MSIELTTMHRRLWWQTGDEQRPEIWDVSADVSDLDICPPDVRHIGDLSLVVADLRRERVALDATVLGEWAPDFIEAAVADSAEGRLQPELEARLGEGPPRLVVVRRCELVGAWRGHRLGPALFASALASFVSMARLAACRVGAFDRGPTRQRPAADSARCATLLERVGFWSWDGVHVVDLRSAELASAREGRWGREH